MPAYTSRRFGHWRLIALDSNLTGAAQAAQLAWLKQELAGPNMACTLAWWHHPLYSSGGHGSDVRMRAAWGENEAAISEWLGLLQQAGAALVLSGHDHDYERFAPQDANGQRDEAHGLRQFVVGTGGAFPTWFGWRLPNSEARYNRGSGVLRLQLEAHGYAWEFLTVDNEFEPVPDHGRGQCH